MSTRDDLLAAAANAASAASAENSTPDDVHAYALAAKTALEAAALAPTADQLSVRDALAAAGLEFGDDHDPTEVLADLVTQAGRTVNGQAAHAIAVDLWELTESLHAMFNGTGNPVAARNADRILTVLDRHREWAGRLNITEVPVAADAG